MLGVCDQLPDQSLEVACSVLLPRERASILCLLGVSVFQLIRGSGLRRRKIRSFPLTCPTHVA